MEWLHKDELSNRNLVPDRHWHQHEVNLRETWGDPDWHIIELVKEWKYTGTITYMIIEASVRNGILTNGWVIEIWSRQTLTQTWG